MSLFAGVLARQHNRGQSAISGDLCSTIVGSLSRSRDSVLQYSAPGFFLAKIDVGAFPTTAWLPPTGQQQPYVATLVGHPFLEDDREEKEDRTEQLRRIASSVSGGDHTILQRCQGIYSFCYYDPSQHSLVLAADKLCNRPLYICVTEQYVFFSTAMRILEAVPQVPKRMDLQGTAEYLAFTHPLADRTVYADIKLLHTAELFMCAQGRIQRARYFHWDAIAPRALREEELATRLYDCFHTAVERRCLGDDCAISMLSGGLDSRCCVSMLMALKKHVYTLSILLPDFLDGRLAVEFARAAGLPNIARPTKSVAPTGEEFARLQMNLEWPNIASRPNQANRVFSGDGGSVGLGHEYLTEERVTQLRHGRRDEVVRQIAVQHALPRRIFHANMHRMLAEAIYDGVASEFATIHCDDPGRDLHVFYLQNDQRRHMYRYSENVDLYRFEHVVPFFDGRVLETIVSSPIDGFLRHRFYHKWIRHFPTSFLSVPWQTYRGHEPCPVPNHFTGRYQWHKRQSDAFVGIRRERMWECARTLLTRKFPSNFLRRPVLAAIWLLHALRLRPSPYVFRLYVDLQRVYAACSGKVVFPESSSDREG